MQEKGRIKVRRTEIFTGLIIILVASSYLTSLLLDFNFVSPHATLLEDLAYLSEHIQNQQISTWSWMATSLITFISIPFYLILFHKKLKVLQYINGLFMLCASIGFFIMGMIGLELLQLLTQSMAEGIEQADEQMKIKLLELFREEQFYRRIGSSFVGLFAFGLSMTRFKLRTFPIFSSFFLVLSGPALIFFNWYDPEHLLRTVAMAGIMIGVTVFCVRTINKGLSE